MDRRNLKAATVGRASSHRDVDPGVRRDQRSQLDDERSPEFYETSSEIGIDELQRCPPDSSDSWFVHHGNPAE
jgi:hypothetical protein